MKRGRRICALVAALLLSLSSGAVAAPMEPDDEAIALSAAHAILIECESGRVVYEKAADERAFMASTTKVMTALVTLERCALSELATVPDEAVPIEGSSAYLARGEKLTVGDLLYALLLSSGNDAAVTLATHAAGSVEDFAALMNARAKALGCEQTNFVNPHGLPDEQHYTTARDLARIAAEAMRLPAFRTIVGTTYHQTESGDRNRTFKNKNRVLWQYEGGCGVKTGFTKAAGRCLVFAAERDGMTLIGCVLHAPNMWEDAFALLDRGFATLTRTRLVDAEKPLASVAVTDGVKKRLAVYPICDILYPLSKSGGDTVDWELRVADALTAPVRAGASAGTLTLRVNGEAVMDTELIVAESVPRASWMGRFMEIIASWIA